MTRSHATLSGSDLRLLYESLVYLRKRTFSPGEGIRLQGVLERVEEILLQEDASGKPLRLSPPEQEALARGLPLYREALTQRGGSVQGIRDAARLREIQELLAPGAGRRSFWARLFRAPRREG